MNDLLLQTTKRRVTSQTMQEHNIEIGERHAPSLGVAVTGTTGATMTQQNSCSNSSRGHAQSSDDYRRKNLDQMELDGLRQLLKSKREAAKHSFNQGVVQAVIRMINKKQNDMMKEAEEAKQEIEEIFGGSQPLYRHRQLQEEVRIGMRGG